MLFFSFVISFVVRYLQCVYHNVIIALLSGVPTSRWSWHLAALETLCLNAHGQNKAISHTRICRIVLVISHWLRKAVSFYGHLPRGSLMRSAAKLALCVVGTPLYPLSPHCCALVLVYTAWLFTSPFQHTLTRSPPIFNLQCFHVLIHYPHLVSVPLDHQLGFVFLRAGQSACFGHVIFVCLIPPPPRCSFAHFVGYAFYCIFLTRLLFSPPLSRGGCAFVSEVEFFVLTPRRVIFLCVRFPFAEDRPHTLPVHQTLAGTSYLSRVFARVWLHFWLTCSTFGFHQICFYTLGSYTHTHTHPYWRHFRDPPYLSVCSLPLPLSLFSILRTCTLNFIAQDEDDWLLVVAFPTVVLCVSYYYPRVVFHPSCSQSGTCSISTRLGTVVGFLHFVFTLLVLLHPHLRVMSTIRYCHFVDVFTHYTHLFVLYPGFPQQQQQLPFSLSVSRGWHSTATHPPCLLSSFTWLCASFFLPLTQAYPPSVTHFRTLFLIFLASQFDKETWKNIFVVFLLLHLRL